MLGIRRTSLNLVDVAGQLQDALHQTLSGSGLIGGVVVGVAVEQILGEALQMIGKERYAV